MFPLSISEQLGDKTHNKHCWLTFFQMKWVFFCIDMHLHTVLISYFLTAQMVSADFQGFFSHVGHVAYVQHGFCNILESNVFYWNTLMVIIFPVISLYHIKMWKQIVINIYHKQFLWWERWWSCKQTHQLPGDCWHPQSFPRAQTN